MTFTTLKKWLQSKSRTSCQGSTSLGFLLFFLMLIILVLFPLLIGNLEYEYFDSEVERAKIATENAIFSTFETVSADNFGKGMTLVETGGFATDLNHNLLKLNCDVTPENLSATWLADEKLSVSFDYQHHFISLPFEKRVWVAVTYDFKNDE